MAKLGNRNCTRCYSFCPSGTIDGVCCSCKGLDKIEPIHRVGIQIALRNYHSGRLSFSELCDYELSLMEKGYNAAQIREMAEVTA